jgi:uncharacterized membrane protein
MELQPWIYLAHIVGATVWIGGGVLLSLVAIRVRRTTELAVMREFAGTHRFIGLAVFTPAVTIVLLSGVWMVLEFGGDFTRLWIALGVGALVLAFLIGALYLSRNALRMERLSREGDLEGARDALGRWLAGYALVLAILVFALWDMVFKPSL